MALISFAVTAKLVTAKLICVIVFASVGNRKGKSLSIIGKLLPIDYRLIIENPSIA